MSLSLCILISSEAGETMIVNIRTDRVEICYGHMGSWFAGGYGKAGPTEFVLFPIQMGTNSVMGKERGCTKKYVLKSPTFSHLDF